MIGLLFQLFAASADGQRYLPQAAAIRHTLTKSAVSASTYGVLRLFHVKHPTATALSVLGPLLIGKAIERHKGHTFGPWDAVNDFAAHALFVVPIATRKALPSLTISLLWLTTCQRSSPRWC